MRVNKCAITLRSTGVTFPDLIMNERVYNLTGGRFNHSPLPPVVGASTGPKLSRPGGGVVMIAV